MKITKSNRNLILFMTFGDGHLSKSGTLEVLHCEKQLDYLEWKRNLLIKNGLNVSDIKKINNNGYSAYKFRTRTYDFIKLYRSFLYSPKKKIANGRTLNHLNELGLAIWYMDDGGLSQKKRNGIVHANDLILNTHLSKEENQVIIDYFKEKWGISFTQVRNKGKYRLRCGTREARKFLEIVRPFVEQVPSMSHKLEIKPKK